MPCKKWDFFNVIHKKIKTPESARFIRCFSKGEPIMKKNFTTLFVSVLTLLFLSCGGSKKFSATGTNDEIVYKAVKFLSKRPDDAYALSELKFNYQQAIKNHEEKLNIFRNSTEQSKWDNIINELSAMQGLYDAVNTSANLLKTTNAQSYRNALAVAKDSGAAVWYEAGLILLNKEGRNNAKEAYHAFKKASDYVPGYKDTQVLMQQAFDKSILNVVINPVRDDIFFRSNWNSGGFGYNREYLQQSLVNDLGGDHSTTNPARFYTDWDARRKNINTDWMIDLVWQNFYMPMPSQSHYTTNRSKKIETGKDTSGKTTYQTVYATLNITRLSYTANGDLEYKVTNIKQNETIEWDRLPSNVSWYQEFATYTGDNRALDSNDWTLINNGQSQRYNSNEEILNEMGRKVYYTLRTRLQQLTDW